MLRMLVLPEVCDMDISVIPSHSAAPCATPKRKQNCTKAPMMQDGLSDLCPSSLYQVFPQTCELPDKVDLEYFLWLAPGMTDGDLVSAATVNYALFKATHSYRNTFAPSEKKVQDALEQWCQNVS